MAADGAELGQLRQKRACGDVTDPRHGHQQCLSLAPDRRGSDGLGDVAVEFREFFLKKADVSLQPPGQLLAHGLIATQVSIQIIPMIGRRRLTGSAKCRPYGSGKGLACGLMRSAKREMTSASSVSVFASRPIALAKSRIWRGLTIRSGSPTAASAAATLASKPPVASKTMETAG